ncbi:MAG: glutathione S-transferase family protein [Gammaproteobacteria bacterium]|nr:glutathione S-transferase family protein [Gammaproteobacteria bacterium]
MAIYLHHYPASLFSEKIRVLLGYHGLAWNSVTIPSIMPRPLLMPLSGGYRKTPILQIDANVYCDTKIIARALARHCGNYSLYQAGFTAHRVADWADTQLFQVVVALNFAPEAVASMMAQFSADEAAAFQQDRAELTDGASIFGFTGTAARAYLLHYLEELEDSLGSGFMFGLAPSIADFSVYHCLWFLNNNEVNAGMLPSFPGVVSWMARISEFGHGQVIESTPEQALAAGSAAAPTCPPIRNVLPEGYRLGEPVQVTPVDYGRIPVAGVLTAWSRDEIVVTREDPRAGSIMVHFPSAGFEVIPDQGSSQRAG